MVGTKQQKLDGLIVQYVLLLHLAHEGVAGYESGRRLPRLLLNIKAILETDNA